MKIHSKRRRFGGKYAYIKYNIILTTDYPTGVALKTIKTRGPQQ